MDLVLAHVDSQFPPGTGVDTYLAADFPNGWSTAAGLPAGIVSRGNAAVGADGSLTIVGLVAGTRYRLAATVGGVLRSVSHYLAPPIDAVPDFGAFADGQFAQWNAAMSEFVGASVDLSAYAPLASPVLTGNPTAPTQAGGNNTTRLATTAFVTAAVAAVGSPSTLTSPVTTDPLTFSGALTFSKAMSLNVADSEGFVYRTGAGRYGYFGIGRTALDGLLGGVAGASGQLFSNSVAGDIAFKGQAAGLLMGTGGNNAATINIDTLGATVLVGRTAASKQLVVKGAASQSAVLQDWQNSAGASLAILTAGGGLNLSAPIGVNVASQATVGVFVAQGSGSAFANVLNASDANATIAIRANGTIDWGAGGASAADTNLYRSAADTLKTDDSLHVGTDLRHLGANLGFYNHATATQQTITGSRATGAALTDLLTKLALTGLIVDGSSA